MSLAKTAKSRAVVVLWLFFGFSSALCRARLCVEIADMTGTQREFPTGVLTLVFTDIEGSSDLWEAHRDAFRPILEEHNRSMREQAALWNGLEVKTEGDAFFLVFDRASDAVRFAVEAQLAFAATDWNAILNGVSSLRVRMGMHTGEPILVEHPNGERDYFGPTVNRAARVGGAGHGGQVIVSEATRSLSLSEMPPSVSFLDMGRHRLKGVGEETLWQVAHPDLPSSFLPLKTLDSARHNLPLQSTAFVGRDREIAECCALLRGETSNNATNAPHEYSSPLSTHAGTAIEAARLLTLIAFGGLGKTRVSLQIAELVADDFSDGVWWVELEKVTDEDSMVERVAGQLRLQLQPQPTAREQLSSFLRERQLLLVLDNLEQIAGAANVINEITRVAPRVKILATTRHELDLQAERVFELLPMPLPDSQMLFVDRARARRADFAITPENNADITELCRRLEGVPLAVELAASRIAGMTPREILDRLGDRFKLLQMRAPDLPPRQRALRGAIDWSYELLQDQDKEMFTQLCVFAGGFSLAAAEEVCDSFDVFESVMELRRQSLLRSEVEVATQQTRYVMLESVRSYGAEILAADDNSIRLRHAQWFAKWGENRMALVGTREENQALDELYAESDNGRAALDWTSRHAAAQGVLCARVAVVMFQVLYHRGLWSEARRVLQGGLEALAQAPNDAASQKLRATLDYHAASLAHDTGDLARAQQGAEASLALRCELNDAPGIADSLNLLGLLAMDAQLFDAARELFEESLLLRGENDHSARARVQHNLALVASRHSDNDEARRLYQESLNHRRKAGDTRGEATTLGNLGALAFKTDDWKAARALYEQSLALRRQMSDQQGIALMLYNLGELAALENEIERATIFFIHAERIFRDLGSVYASAPQEEMTRISERIGAPQWAELRRASELKSWEELT